MNRKGDSEKYTESYLCRKVAASGGLCLKYYNPNDAGYPDRLVVLPGGRFIFVELKSKGCKPRPLQRLRMAELAGLGAAVAVCSSPDEVDALLQTTLKT